MDLEEKTKPGENGGTSTIDLSKNSGNYDGLLYVPEGSWETTTPKNNKPLLATPRSPNSILIVAYDIDRELAFLSNSGIFSYIPPCYPRRERDKGNRHVQAFYDQLRDQGEFNLDVSLITGSHSYKDRVDITKKSLRSTPENVALRSLRQIGGNKIGGIAIDSGTGEISYGPELYSGQAIKKLSNGI